MCRLFAFTNALKSSQLSNTLSKFGNLAENGKTFPGSASGHRDGWGASCYKNGKILYTEKRPADASKDPLYSKTTQKIYQMKPDFGMLHLRKQSVGMTRQVNTHPFVLKEWSLCHNGMLYHSKHLPLPQKTKKFLRGTSDSERIFLYLVGNIPPKKNFSLLKQSLIKSIHSLKTNYEYLALNLLLSNGRMLWAIREVNSRHPLLKEGRYMPYFSLYVARNSQKEITALCSEKISLKKSTWRPLPNHTLLEINLQTWEEKMYPLSTKP